MGYKMNGWSGYQSSPAKQKRVSKTTNIDKKMDEATKFEGTKEVEKKNHKEGDHTQYEHPVYYNHDGSINKGSSTGDFDEGELSEVMKNQDGKRYVERSDGKLLFLDKPQ
tara:strand:+ start:435 stop:764 length:330 start_codon:yes stop_codon:yes gene_type:complete